MDHVKQKVKCPNCDCQVDLVISEFGGKVVVEPPAASPYVDKKELIEHYKRIKGFKEAAGKAWDQEHRLRAFYHAKKILAAIPVVETAKRSIDWTSREWKRRGLGSGNEWNLATVEKWVAEFLVDDQKKRAMASKPKCKRCLTVPSEDGAIVCLECSWCWKCSDAGRESRKDPKDIVARQGEQPTCQACDKETK